MKSKNTLYNKIFLYNFWRPQYLLQVDLVESCGGILISLSRGEIFVCVRWLIDGAELCFCGRRKLDMNVKLNDEKVDASWRQ